MSGGWGQTLFSGAQRQDKGQRAQTEAEEAPAEHEEELPQPLYHWRLQVPAGWAWLPISHRTTAWHPLPPHVTPLSRAKQFIPQGKPRATPQSRESGSIPRRPSPQLGQEQLPAPKTSSQQKVLRPALEPQPSPLHCSPDAAPAAGLLPESPSRQHLGADGPRLPQQMGRQRLVPSLRGAEGRVWVQKATKRLHRPCPGAGAASTRGNRGHVSARSSPTSGESGCGRDLPFSLQDRHRVPHLRAATTSRSRSPHRQPGHELSSNSGTWIVNRDLVKFLSHRDAAWVALPVHTCPAGQHHGVSDARRRRSAPQRSGMDGRRLAEPAWSSPLSPHGLAPSGFSLPGVRVGRGTGGKRGFRGRKAESQAGSHHSLFYQVIWCRERKKKK